MKVSPGIRAQLLFYHDLRAFLGVLQIHQWDNGCSPGNESPAWRSDTASQLFGHVSRSICLSLTRLSLLSESVVCWSWEEGDYGSLCACWSEIRLFPLIFGGSWQQSPLIHPCAGRPAALVPLGVEQAVWDQASTLGPALPCLNL